MGKPILNMDFQLISKDYFSYVKELLPELGKYYDGHENSKFFDQLINKEKNDTNGYFTLKKEIWIAKVNNNFCGFVCLNYKRGNTVKIGPIIVDPLYRGHGVGNFLINSSIEKLKKENIRKIYATTSSENIFACKLFENNGFKIEIKLPEQYKKESTEIIWGYFINVPKKRVAKCKSLFLNKKEKTITVSSFNKTKDENLLKKMINIMSEWHDDINQSFCDQLIKATKNGIDFEKKGKLILVAKNISNKSSGIAVATPKRGGSIKIYPMSGNIDSIKLLIGEIIKIFKKNGYRKLYTFVPVNDQKYIQQLIQFGFNPRGTILSPYKPGYDLTVLDMFIKI